MNSIAYVNNSLVANNLILIDSSASVSGSPINGIYSSNSVPGYSQVNAPAFISLNSRSVYGPNYYSNESSLINFVSYNSEMFALNSSSPAVDAAAPSVVNTYSFCNTDIESKTRPAGAAPDFGAYEQASTYSFESDQYVRVFPNPVTIRGAQLQTVVECAASPNFSNVELNLSTLDSNPVLLETIAVPASDCLFNGDLLRIPANWSSSGLNPGLYVIEVYIDQQFSGAVRLLVVY